jgi:phosphatidylserine decarboxylase
MTFRASIMKVLQQEWLNFLLTNAMPRRQATQAMGWFSKIEHPLVARASIRVWRFFSDVDLSDAQDVQFRSLHHAFIRRLKDGARAVAIAPDVLVSPCDAIIGASGRLDGCTVLQVKGLAYALGDLLDDPAYAETFRDGCYVTLRLTAGMYHRFHAPHKLRVDSVTHIFGDTWNVNPVTLKRVKRLFCRNERAVIRTTLANTGQPVTLVAVAAILVAGIRLKFLEMPVGRDRRVLKTYRCAVGLRKGEEMGWFEHGSTILVFAPAGFTLAEDVTEGVPIRMGAPLLRVPVNS